MKKVSFLIVACILLFNMCPLMESNEATSNVEANLEVIEHASTTPEVGQTYTFGSYEQDDNTGNGKEEIEWFVLDKQDDRILVISKYALDCKPYNETLEDVTWETCTLRTWLNNDFINSAFSDEEKSRIPMVTVLADKQNAGNDIDTQDKVFLLSLSELNEYFAPGNARKCTATTYAESRGAVESYHGECCWWLRSAVEPVGNTNLLNYVGSTYGADAGTSNIYRAVRPAMWITIE